MIELQPLLPGHIPFGMQLKSRAGWNQLAQDWEILLSLSAGGSYLAYLKGVPAGTVTTITYNEQFSWIGMVLVDPRYRGHGIGTKLLQSAIAYACRHGTVLLDATPQGRKLYLTLGFQDICELERLQATTLKLPTKIHPEIHPISERLMAALIDFDARHFGARREVLLRSLFRHAPEYGFVALKAGVLVGYCLGRHGSQFEQIGPLQASDELTACSLFLAAAHGLQERPMIVDIMNEQASWRSFLLALGFSVQRPFTRMALGEWTAQADRSGQFAIAGPEMG